MTKFCSGALIVKGNRFLFGKRAEGESTYAGLWDIVGGHGEEGEAPEDTLKRELKEEIGIEPTEYRLFYEVPVDDDNEPYQFYIFLVTEWEGEIRNCCNEHSEIKWLTSKELRKLNLSSPNYEVLFDKWEREHTS